VGKKRRLGASPPKLKTFSVRLPSEAAARVEDAADALGLDAGNLLRSMILRYLPVYEKEAERVRAKLPPE
jgi:hypothetical protein